MNLSGPKWWIKIYYDVAQKDWIFNTKVHQSEVFFDIQYLFDGMTLNTFLHSLMCVFVSKKKEWVIISHCLRECCVWYNLPYISLKVTITFEWSCGVSLC